MDLRIKELLDIKQLTKWILVYSYLEPRDGDVCDDFQKTLSFCGKQFGIEVEKPIELIVKDGKLETFL